MQPWTKRLEFRHAWFKSDRSGFTGVDISTVICFFAHVWGEGTFGQLYGFDYILKLRANYKMFILSNRSNNAQSLPYAPTPKGKIHPLSKMAITFELLMQFWCPSRFRMFFDTIIYSLFISARAISNFLVVALA